jgi:hypothetical protein
MITRNGFRQEGNIVCSAKKVQAAQEIMQSSGFTGVCIVKLFAKLLT